MPKTITLNVRNFPKDLSIRLRMEATRRDLSLEKFIVLVAEKGLAEFTRGSK